jgi:ornithine decarboxylase
MQSPKFILSKKKILEQYDKLDEICDRVSYSSKTNSVVTKILEDERDCLFSVHLDNELRNIKDCSRVLFLAQGWDKQEIKELTSRGINRFVVDNEVDLNELENFLEENDVKVNLFLRIKLKENTLRTEKYFVFGMSSEVVNAKIKYLRENEKINDKIGCLGVHFHRKTQNMSEWNLRYEFEEMIDSDNLKYLSEVNIGGGLPSEYANTNVDVIKGILSKIKEFREWLNAQGVKMMIESGRFIAAPAGKLVTGIKTVYENNIVVDASVYNSDMDAIIVPVKLLIEGELSSGEVGAMPYVIKGITPCSMDLFRYKVYLKNPKKGDKLIFLNAGAYNFSTDFCDLGKVEVEVVEEF